MSCYNWEATEQGGIKIPAKEWVSVRTDILKKYNEHQDYLYNTAVKAWEAIRKLPRKLRTDAWKRREVIEQLASITTRDPWRVGRECTLDGDSIWRIEQVLRSSADAGRVLKPLKKDFPAVPVTKSVTLHMGEAALKLSNADRAIHWRVSENNHAVETANEHPVIQYLWPRLNRVQWIRGSGGRVIGNDEYNQDVEAAGCGAHYVTREFGPSGKRALSRY